MKLSSSLLVVVLALAAIPAFGDDQEKAQKEIKKITAIASDQNTRGVVNRSISEMLNVKRLDLVKDRQDTNLNYGGLFLALELTSTGAKMDDIAAQLKAGKTIFDIANGQHPNWKQINDQAKKLNHKIDDNLAKALQDPKKEAGRDNAADYDVHQDRVASDSDASKDELAEAQRRYQQALSGGNSNMDMSANPNSQSGNAMGNSNPTGGGKH
jgi:hypothetical protein